MPNKSRFLFQLHVACICASETYRMFRWAKTYWASFELFVHGRSCVISPPKSPAWWHACAARSELAGKTWRTSWTHNGTSWSKGNWIILGWSFNTKQQVNHADCTSKMLRKIHIQAISSCNPCQANAKEEEKEMLQKVACGKSKKKNTGPSCGHTISQGFQKIKKFSKKNTLSLAV